MTDIKGIEIKRNFSTQASVIALATTRIEWQHTSIGKAKENFKVRCWN
jgi:hypothetical protein